MKKQKNGKNTYHFFHNDGKKISPTDTKGIIVGELNVLPDENGNLSNLVGIGVYTVPNGKLIHILFFLT